MCMSMCYVHTPDASRVDVQQDTGFRMVCKAHKVSAERIRVVSDGDLRARSTASERARRARCEGSQTATAPARVTSELPLLHSSELHSCCTEQTSTAGRWGHWRNFGFDYSHSSGRTLVFPLDN